MRLIPALAIVAILLPQFGFGQEEKKPDERKAEAEAGSLFERLDANKDGQVTADEVSADRKNFFDRLLRVNDKNADGKLSKEEFAQGTQAGDRPNRPAGENPQRRPQQPPQGNPPQDAPDAGLVFKRLDANADGKLVPDEMPEERRAQFRENLARVDKDGDGGVNLEEFRAIAGFFRPQGLPPQNAPRGNLPPGPDGRPNLANAPFFRAMDSNGDGKISADELAGAAAALKKLDRNDDGFLTPEELIPPGPMAGRPPQGTPPGQPPLGQAPPSATPARPGQGAPGANVFAERLKRADTNGDGKLSKEEAPDRLKENFDRIDTNKDGFLDAEETQRSFDRRPGAAPGNTPRQRRPAANPEPRKDGVKTDEPKKDADK